MMLAVIKGFIYGWRSGRTHHKKCVREAKSLRNHLSQSQIDEMVEESFPASDPPSTY